MSQNAQDAARFAAALAPLQALLTSTAVMTERCRTTLEEATRELDENRLMCLRAEAFLTECARVEAEEG